MKNSILYYGDYFAPILEDYWISNQIVTIIFCLWSFLFGKYFPLKYLRYFPLKSRRPCRGFRNEFILSHSRNWGFYSGNCFLFTFNSYVVRCTSPEIPQIIAEEFSSINIFNSSCSLLYVRNTSFVPNLIDISSRIWIL